MFCVATVQGETVAPQPISTTGWPCGTDLQAFNMYKLWCYQGLYWSFQGVLERIINLYFLHETP